MKNSWEFDINIHVKAHLFSEITDKLRIIIKYNKVRDTVFPVKFNESDTVYTDSIDFSYKHKHDIFKKAVHNNHYININFSVDINE